MTIKRLSEPLVPADVDLRAYPWTPIHRTRLFHSWFNANVSDTAWRVGFTLWLKAWDEVPAGSLPSDDTSLCRLAELGRDLKTWQEIKEQAMHGWAEAPDGRLYHRTVAEVVTEAWTHRQAQRDRTEKARASRLSQSRKSIATGSVTEPDNTIQNLPAETPSLGKIPLTGGEAAQGTESDIKPRSLSSPRARVRNGHDPENIKENGSLGSLRSPAAAAPPPLRQRRKAQLVQKLMRFAHATMDESERRAAIEGLTGLDAEHSMQWWLDHLDQRMRAKHWEG